MAGSLSVSDDTIYRALKKLGSSHVSAPPKAYKQNAEDAFEKTSWNTLMDISIARYATGHQSVSS